MVGSPGWLDGFPEVGRRRGPWRGDGRKIYWALPPRAKTIRCGTAQRAKNYAKTAIARRRNHRYEPLVGNITIRRRPANHGAELEQALATILFVDIVRSTEKAARLGDWRWTQVMNYYYAAVRRELKTLRGKEVVTTGDGLLATFDAPASGVRCATAIREAVRTLGLEIRVGLHAGEYKVSGADVVGLAFHVGARVAAKARAGEVLVSSAVKDRMSQSGIRFKDRGVHRLKACRSGGACTGSNIKRCPAKVDIGFAIGSIVRLPVPRVRMATGWAPGKVRRRVRPGHADLRWAAPIWSISASQLSVHSFTCPFVALLIVPALIVSGSNRRQSRHSRRTLETSKMTKKATCEFTWSLPQGPIKAFVTAWLSDDAVALLKEYRRQCGRVSALDHARH